MLRQAGREIPPFSDDDVVDYQVTEAVLAKVAEEREQSRKDAERAAWRKNHRKTGQSQQ